MRAFWLGESSSFKGAFCSTEGIVLEPYPAQRPAIWIGSRGSEAGLRQTAHVGYGWLASAYNTIPEEFASAWGRLREHVQAAGKDPNRFPNALATMFFFVTEERAAAGRIIREVLSPTLMRPQNRWSLALPERERFGLVYAREPVRHRRGDTIRTTRALPPLPLQHRGQRLAVEVPHLLMRKLADGEVYLLLAGTCSAERYTQDLHLCATGTRILRVDTYLATWSGLRSRNKTPQMASTVGSRKARRSTIVAAGRQA